MIKDQTQEYYQRRASEYEKIYFRDNPARQAELARMYASSREVLADRSVLDLACGTGFWTQVISQSAQAVVGIDINTGTLAEAKRKRFSCPVWLIQGNFLAIPIRKQSVNGLLATYVISHIKRQDLPRLWVAIRRTLLPGSQAFFCDNNRICEIEPEMIWDGNRINSYKRRRLENGEEYLILKNYFEREELIESFSSLGAIDRLIFDTYYWSATLKIQA